MHNQIKFSTFKVQEINNQQSTNIMESPIFNIIIGKRLSGKKTRATDIIKNINPDGVYTVTFNCKEYPACLKGVHGRRLKFSNVMAYLDDTKKSPLLYLNIGLPEITNEFWVTLTSLRCHIPCLNIIMVLQCVPPSYNVSWFPIPVTGVDFSGDDGVWPRRRVWEMFYQKCVTLQEFEVALSNKSRFEFLHTNCKDTVSIHTTTMIDNKDDVLDQLKQVVVQLNQVIDTMMKK